MLIGIPLWLLYLRLTYEVLRYPHVPPTTHTIESQEGSGLVACSTLFLTTPALLCAEQRTVPIRFRLECKFSSPHPPVLEEEGYRNANDRILQ